MVALKILPQNIVPENVIIKRFLWNKTSIIDIINNQKKMLNTDCFCWQEGEHLLIKYFKKLESFTNQKVNFISQYFVTKSSFFKNMNNQLNKLSIGLNKSYAFSSQWLEQSKPKQKEFRKLSISYQKTIFKKIILNWCTF